VAIATTIGVALFQLLPRRLVEGLVALMLLAGAVLAGREAAKARQVKPSVAREASSGHQAVTTAFIVIFLAEWGDLTQVLTADLAAHYHSPLSVGVGALLALWAVAALAVVGGQGIVRFVDIRTVRIVTAVVLVVLAGLATWQAVR
jgi:putative Ca2+/H+ antiporter (TMEM165/GDT1 family)